MGKRNHLHTMRLSSRERALVAEYLRKNPLFDGFSALARVATLTFIGQAGSVRLRPAGPQGPESRPRFLWDYDLSAAEARELLARPGMPPAKLWLIGRILSQARFEEAMQFLSVDEVREALPRVRVPARVRERWGYAIERWALTDAR